MSVIQYIKVGKYERWAVVSSSGERVKEGFKSAADAKEYLQ